MNGYILFAAAVTVISAAAAGTLWGKDLRRFEGVILTMIFLSFLGLLFFVLFSNTQVYADTYDNSLAWRESLERGGKLLSVTVLAGFACWLTAKLLTHHHHNNHLA